MIENAMALPDTRTLVSGCDICEDTEAELVPVREVWKGALVTEACKRCCGLLEQLAADNEDDHAH